jgi:hypothetical protein
MKVLLTFAAVLALSTSFVAAQTNDNGLSLGKSMPGSTAGVPYPDRAATSASGAKNVSSHRKHRKHHHYMH